MLEVVANHILLYVHQLVLISVRFVGLLLVESPDCVQLVLTDIVCTDLSQHFAGRIADSLENMTRCIVETVFIDIGIQPVGLPKFHDSGPQFIDVYKALPEHLFAFTFAVYNMYSSGSSSLASEP